jgi:PAS domain S-box-containing protein
MEKKFKHPPKNPVAIQDMQYRLLFDNANDAIFIIRDNHFVECNKKTLEMFACTREQIIGKNPFSYSPPKQRNGDDSKSAGLAKINTAMSGVPQKFEWTHQKYDGSTFDAEVSLNRIELNSEYCLQAIVRDITERRLLEQYLYEREQLYRTLFEDNYSVMLLIDPDSGAIVDANPAACSYYGYSVNNLRNMKITELNTLSTEAVFEEMEKARSERRNYFNFRHRLSGGVVRDVEVYSGPITVKGKSMLCSVVHDISQRIIAERENKRLIRDLQQALSEVKTLRGFLPICSSCKKIRDDKGLWNRIESYVQNHTEATFSHGMCPECMDSLYGDQAWYKKKETKRIEARPKAAARNKTSSIGNENH